MKNKNNKKKVVAVYLSPILHKKVTSLATKEHRSFSGQVSYMINKYFDMEHPMGSITFSGRDIDPHIEVDVKKNVFTNID